MLRRIFNREFASAIKRIKSYSVTCENKFCDYAENEESNAPSDESWRILFFGSDKFAAESLKALHSKYKDKKLVRHLEIVTAYQGQENCLTKYARKNKIPLHVWPPEISEGKFDIGIVVSFGHLIPEKIINKFPLGMINVHASLLPRWRGAAPICHALINGDTYTGISIMKIAPKKFDIGSVIMQQRIEIHPDDTQIELYDKLSKLGAEVLLRTVDKLPNILNSAQSQDEKEVSNAPKITKDTSFVNWAIMTAKNVCDLQRGLNGIYPLRTYFNNVPVKILNVKLVTDTSNIPHVHEKTPGITVYDKSTKKLYVCCKDDTWVSVEKIVIPDHRPLNSQAFGSGYIMNTKEKYCLFG
ncbi:hypothetical protein TKK_0011741 [Trichogramma kaykai]|uniref:Methionyl-tRNA formyltransferase, mitochondrial n=1 Tax=Trichogramma kaykai TaxID=54128 RepID=A0ABD2WQH1_9HYME